MDYKQLWVELMGVFENSTKTNYGSKQLLYMMRCNEIDMARAERDEYGTPLKKDKDGD